MGAVSKQREVQLTKVRCLPKTNNALPDRCRVSGSWFGRKLFSTAKLASYPGPFSWCESRMGSRRKGLVHTVHACARFSTESWNFLLSAFARNGKCMRALNFFPSAFVHSNISCVANSSRSNCARSRRH